MTNCYNCGHTGTFVLLVQLALSVPGPDAPRGDADASGECRRDRPDDRATGREVLLDSEELSLTVQCPVCESTDVGLAAADLLAR